MTRINENCPFCGKIAVEVDEDDGRIKIGCETICCRGSVYLAPPTHPYNAHVLWNRRSNTGEEAGDE